MCCLLRNLNEPYTSQVKDFISSTYRSNRKPLDWLLWKRCVLGSSDLVARVYVKQLKHPQGASDLILISSALDAFVLLVIAVRSILKIK